MSIRCGHCGGIHDSVQDVRDCSTENAGNETQEVRDYIVPGDPWEGATESEAGVWSPGPAAYLQARREPPRDPVDNPSYGAVFEDPNAPKDEWGGYKNAVKELTEGFYAMDEGVYQTVRSRAGRLYAKALNEATGSWEYSAGAIMKLKPEMRLTLDAAKNFGHRTGRCSCCGRTLTNPDSIEAGIGPICASRYF